MQATDGIRGGVQISNGVWAALDSLMYPLVMLAGTPLFAAALQESGFGLWILFLTVTAIGAAASAGTASAAIRMVAQCVGRGTEAAVGGIVRSALAVAVSGFGAVAVLLCVASVPVATLFFGKLGAPAVVSWACMAGIAVAWVEHIDQVYSAVWKGMEAFAGAAKIELTFKMAQFCLFLIGLSAGIGVSGLIALHLLSSIARLSAKRTLTLRRFPQIAPKAAGHVEGGRGVDVERAAEVWRLSLWGWLQGAGGLAFGTIDRLFVGALLGPVGLAQYAVGMQLASQFHALAAAGLSILAPEVSRLSARSMAGGTLVRRIAGYMTVNAITCAIGYAVLVWVAPDIIVAWLGRGIRSEIAAFMLPMIVAYFMLSLNVVPFHALSGLGRMREIALISAAAGALAAVAAAFWVPNSGLQGASWSRVVYSAGTLALLPMLGSSLSRRR